MSSTLLYLFFSTFFFISPDMVNEKIPLKIESAFKNGNSTLLAEHFNSNIEITIANSHAIYSRTQAELIVQDFFRHHRPIAFKMIQEDNTSKPIFGIGRLTTAKKSYRVYVSLMPKDGGLFINQLKIDIEE